MYNIPYELNYYRFIGVNYVHILSLMIQVKGLSVMEEALYVRVHNPGKDGKPNSAAVSVRM
jgi:hypothetical protein